MKKILFFMAIVSFTSFGLVSCSEDDPVVEAPVPNPNPNVGEQLRIVHNGKFRLLGSEAIFEAMSGTTQIQDAVFYVDGKEIPGNKYSQSTIGEVKVQARRAGYVDSEFVTIQFAQKPY
ncbi:MAG TPA: hypothetical protein VKY44_08290 [Flavobacterium sp.]|nr:hypothetical protein [Flavobacterium sp.]